MNVWRAITRPCSYYYNEGARANVERSIVWGRAPALGLLVASGVVVGRDTEKKKRRSIIPVLRTCSQSRRRDGADGVAAHHDSARSRGVIVA